MIIKKEEAKSIVILISELFKTRGFEVDEHDGWVIPKGSDYAMKGYWYPNATENVGQLTIEVFMDSEMVMVESFAGMGESEEVRLREAFSSFVFHSFHVFLFAVWGEASEEVSCQEWEVMGVKYQAYIGQQGILNYDRENLLEVPSSYNEKMKGVIGSEKLEKPFHWFTLFYANLNGLDNQAEVLKDNIKWSVGEKMLTSLAWKRSNHYYAVRQFVILKKV